MAQGIRRAQVVVVDASALFAIADADDVDHEICVAALELIDGVIAVSPFALAEADYLVNDRLGVDAELGLLRDVEKGAFRLHAFEVADLTACVGVLQRYRDLNVGLSDASTVVLADRLRTRRVFTLDRQHFETMHPLSGGRFDLLPD